MDKYKNPVFRKTSKDSWIVKNGFSVEQTKDGKHVWKQVPVATAKGSEPFVLDLKTLGQKGIGRNE